jgi:hypothetical protein
MFENIINTVFSIPYLLIGVLLAIMLDLFIYKFKASTRLTFLEIWGCVMFWPILLIIVIVGYLSTIND